MLSFLITWSILLPVCLLIGLLILNLCNGYQFTVSGDRFIISIWLGIVILCLCCITIALFFPVSPMIGGIMSLAWILVSLLSQKVRRDFYQLFKLLSPQNFIKGLILSIAIAIFTSQQIIWFDTGLYHLGSIHWISQFGAVPGVGLINSKFGFTSSWFAFSAPLIFDWTEGKIGAISNGYLMLISFFHISIILHKSKENILTIPNLFIGFFLLLIMVIYILDNTNGNSLISFSHDIPVALLIGIISWSMLIITSNSFLPPRLFTLDSNLIPLLLATGTISIKLTAIPVFGVILLFYFWSNKSFIKQSILVVSLIFILLLPNALFSIKTSGCPIYPSQIMCLNLPWTMNTEIIKTENDQIIGMEKIAADSNPIMELIQKRWKWFKSSIKMQITVFLYGLSLILGILIIRQKNLSLKSTQNWLVFLGILGTSFIMIVVPLIRFGMGYFLLIPSLFGANYCYHKKYQFKINIFKQIHQPIKKFSWLIITIILLISGASNLENRLLFPAKLLESTLIKAQNNDVEYTYPADFYLRCWGAELPCAALPIKSNIQLRDANKGIKAGFEFK